jgi:5'-methylthioadenosine phosphorylase
MSSSGHSCQKSRRKLSAEKRSLIGVIGGSGIYRLPEMTISETVEVDTPYGKPSGPVSIGELCGGRIAFLPRHGERHTIPPHKVPYKANLAALKSLGAQHVIGTCVVGSLRKEIKPGAFVVPDQFINLTWGRDDTFEVDHEFVHLPTARPYCENVRRIIARELKAMRISHRTKGTVVVVQGPRFSTIAESKMFALMGGDIVNMTQYPECYFARELGICYGVIATVTDHDASVPSLISMQPGSMERVLAIFRGNTTATVLLLGKLTGLVEELADCDCATKRLAEYYGVANDESS